MDHHGFLTDEEIMDRRSELFRIEKGDDFAFENALGASYDMRLGSEVYISGEDSPRLLNESNPFVSLPRGKFGLLLTKEYVTMPPDHSGLISVRTTYKEKGLLNTSGFHVDPGFKGRLYFSVFNVGPNDIQLKHNEPMFMIFFGRLSKSANQKESKGRQGQEHLPIALVTSLKGTSASLADVDRRVGSLETLTRVLLTLSVALVAAIITVALAK